MFARLVSTGGNGMRTLLAIGAPIALLALPAMGGAQPMTDHLRCYKVKDPAPKAAYTADLGGLAPDPGCMVRVPAVMACVPATKTNVQPPPPGGGGTGTPNTFGCYKVKCPKGTPPPLQLNDQFGSRTVVPSSSKMLCAPSCLYVPFAPVVQDVIDGFRLDPSGDLNVPSSCGGVTPVCCPGGTPVSPCGPLQFDFVQQAGDPPSELIPVFGDPNTFDAVLQTRLKTVTDIPVTVPVAGDCGLHIDTTPRSIAADPNPLPGDLQRRPPPHGSGRNHRAEWAHYRRRLPHGRNWLSDRQPRTELLPRHPAERHCRATFVQHDLPQLRLEGARRLRPVIDCVRHPRARAARSPGRSRCTARRRSAA